MPYVVWDARFSVGVPEIDEDHQHLFFLLNRLYDDFTGKGGSQDLRPLFDELIDYATYHFAAEENWMQDNQYPGFAGHQQEHARFSQRVVEMDNDPLDRERHLTLEVLAFLNNWLQTHILHADAEFARFIAADNKRTLRSRGITKTPI